MLLDNFYLLGITYEELDLIERERFIKDGPRKKMEALLNLGLIKGYVLLETCLRVEIYLETENIIEVREKINIHKFSVIKSNKNAVEYLFQVVCGYHSIIKGEEQILAQVKNSYLKNLEEKKTTKDLNVIFNKAIELGKKFRHLSEISKNAMSLEAIALKFIKNHFDTLDDKRIFIVGTGDMALAVLNIFTRNNIKNIVMTNRSRKRVLELQKKYDIDVIDFADRYEEIGRSQIIISATAAHHLIFKKEKMEDLMGFEEKILLDLAVPRDIDEKIDGGENTNLYNLDHLWNVYHGNEKNRSELISKYNYLLEDQIKRLKKHLEYSRRAKGGK